jgi:methionyl-tRNA formyltransferase
VSLAPPPAGPVRRIAYLGTPALAVPPLDALVEDGVDVALVVTQPDRRRGRGGASGPAPVKAAAERLGLPVSHRVEDVVEADVPLGVVVAFGRRIRPPVLEAVPMVNVHFSLLPRWRGAAPVERAILAGDVVTGVDLMAVEEGLDTGGVYERVEVPIGPDDTLAELRDRLVAEGSAMLRRSLRAGLGAPAPQVGEPTYADKLTADDRRIDWSRPALDVHRRVRLGDAWTTHRGRRLKVWRTHVPPRAGGPEVPAGDGPVELVEVQPEGKARMDAAAWARGARWEPGDRLGP